MSEHAQEAAAAQDAAMSEYVKSVAGPDGNGTASQIQSLADLRDRGTITEAEFQTQRPRSWPDVGPAQRPSTATERVPAPRVL
jgi:hypothetical protein